MTNINLNDLIHLLSNEQSERKQLEKALLSILLLLPDKKSYSGNVKMFPLPYFEDFAHYLLIQNQHISSLFDSEMTYSFSDSQKHGEVIVQRHLDSKGHFQLRNLSLESLAVNDELAIQKTPDYDVAISFAGEQRETAELIARKLKGEFNLKVFYDDYEKLQLWGNDLFSKLYQVYSRDSTLCLVLFSKEYLEKIWTRHELRAVYSRILNKPKSSLLPIRLDEVDIPIELETLSYLNYRTEDINGICQLINQRIWDERWQSWYTKEELSEYLERLEINNLFVKEFCNELDKEKDGDKILIKAILALIFFIGEDVNDELKGFFDFILYGMESISKRFKHDQYPIISPDGYFMRVKQGPAFLAIQTSYWKPIFAKYRQ